MTDIALNHDATYQTVTWKAIDHMFYRPSDKHQPMKTFEHYNPRYTEKNLFYSCSIIAIPYIHHGENIKRTSITIESTGSLTYDKFSVRDDKYGNLRDDLIDSSSFASKNNLVGYWGFNDEFRNFELNFGRLGSYTLGKESLKVYPSQVNKKYLYSTTAHKVNYVPGITTTGAYTTASGIGAAFESASNAYIITDHDDKFNFRNDESFAISFWVKSPMSQSVATEKVTSNTMITKRGVEKELVRKNRWLKGKNNRTTYLKDTNISRTRYPFDISIANQSNTTITPGSIIFKRSNGTRTLEYTSSLAITGSSWKHVVCQKSGSHLQIYINGKLNTQDNDVFHTDDQQNTMNPSALTFGALNMSSSNGSLPFSGSLDEIRIYDKWLPTSSIENLANNDYYSSSAYQSNVAGNAFYRTGQIVISSPLPKYHYALQNVFKVEHKSARTIYENEVLVKVPSGESNVSMNPTLRKAKSALIQNQFTGSAWKPYITTVGLYDDSARLLAVAKFARPIQKREDIDMNFLIRWDY